MTISVEQVSQLRASTGAGMMDCKKALEEANGDMDKAAEILRKKGIVKAAKRADKIAAEGLTNVKTAGNAAVIVELNSETDFVSKGDDFKKLLEEITDELLAKKPADLTAALQGGIEDKIGAVVAKLGEKISLRRFAVVEKTAADAFGAYIHMGGRISVLTVLTGTTDEALARDVAMHAAAANPRYLKRDEVPATVMEKEKEIYADQLKAQNKPANIIENIVKGKLDKFYGEVCLREQPFVKDEEKTVEKYVAQKAPGAVISFYARFELGEGIEKKVSNFADEVAQQMEK